MCAYSRLLTCCVVPLLTAVSAGCGCKGDGAPQRYNVTVSMDSSLSGKNIQVNIVAVNADALRNQWESHKVTDYWLGHDHLMDYPTYSMVFGLGRETQQRFDSSKPEYNKLWAAWESRGATSLVVLANLIDYPEPTDPSKDARRLTVPLGKCHWKDLDKRKGLMFNVSSVGIELMKK